MSAHSCGYFYLRCTKHAENKSCPGCGTIKMRELEALVYQQMVKKLEDYKTLTGRKKKRAASPKLTAKQMELAQVESEIAKLTAEAVSPEQIDTISNYLDDWENIAEGQGPAEPCPFAFWDC
jgi:site-specific DNA recombinase